MNNTSSTIGDSLRLAPYQLNIWFGSFLWITGNMGCMSNMVVFRSRTLRKRAYSIYLFAAALADFHYFNFVLITRILEKGFGVPLYGLGNVVGFSLFSFATIDRLLSAQRSNIYRRWSNRVCLAYKMVIIIPLFWFVLFGHRIILYEIKNGVCGPPQGFYKYYDNYFQVVFSSISPAVAMSILAYLLIKSVRGVSRRRIAQATIIPIVVNSPKTIIHQIDAHLTMMLILESLIASITYIPYATELTYSNITQVWYKSSLRIAEEKVFTELIHLFSYIFFATSFYVSVLSNVGFRRKFMRLIKRRRHPEPGDRGTTVPHT